MNRYVAVSMLLCWIVAPGRAGGPPASRPTSSADPHAALPDDVRATLAGTSDFSLSFSQPGFYALLRYVKNAPRPPDAANPIAIEDWRVLLERPADFRGLPVTITGTLGRNKAWEFVQPERRDLGRVWQLELWSARQPLAVTAILTDDAGDIPIGATVRITGYFLMIRNYYDSANRLHQAALIIGNAPTLVSRAAPVAGQHAPAGRALGLVVAVGIALVLVWLILRRATAGAPPTLETLHASRPAPESLAEDLAVWAAQEPELTPDEDSPPPGAPPEAPTP